MSELKVIDLDEYDIKREELMDIDMKSICSYNVFPFYFDESKVCVASFNKVSKDIINDLKFLLKKEIFVYTGYKEQIEKYIRIYTSLELGHKAINDMKKEEQNQKVYEVKKTQNYSPSVLLVDSIIDLALSKNGSDIHIEPFKGGAAVRIRIDGVLKKVMDFPFKAYESVCIRIKIMADMNIVIKKAPQDGRMYYKNCDFRVSSIPTIFGEKIVIRILYRKSTELSFSDITGENKDEIVNLFEKPYGMLLITGPTGSGKSTTLYSAMAKLNSEEKNIVTIEEPVEMIIKGINQINVNNEAGITFSSGLKNILRQDPDIIMVGEIRDETTAEIAVRAAITGHLVLSTLHTNDAFSAINRLCDMGVKKYLILDALNGVIAQRLVRKLCIHCKQEYKPNDYEREVLGLNSKAVLYKAKGCSRCDFTGYSGRKAVFEIININDEVRSMMSKTITAEDIKKYFINKGIKTLKNNGMELVKSGETTFNEFKRIIYNI